MGTARVASTSVHAIGLINHHKGEPLWTKRIDLYANTYSRCFAEAKHIFHLTSWSLTFRLIFVIRKWRACRIHRGKCWNTCELRSGTYLNSAAMPNTFH